MVIPGGSFSPVGNMGALQCGVPQGDVSLLHVRQIFLAGVPLKRINILCFLFTSPKISHLHCLRALSFDGVIGYPDGSYIITVDGGFGLRVAKVFESESKNHSFLAI